MGQTSETHKFVLQMRLSKLCNLAMDPLTAWTGFLFSSTPTCDYFLPGCTKNVVARKGLSMKKVSQSLICHLSFTDKRPLPEQDWTDKKVQLFWSWELQHDEHAFSHVLTCSRLCWISFLENIKGRKFHPASNAKMPPCNKLDWKKVNWDHIEERHSCFAIQTSAEQSFFGDHVNIVYAVEKTVLCPSIRTSNGGREILFGFWGEKAVGVHRQHGVETPCHWTKAVIGADGFVITVHPIKSCPNFALGWRKNHATTT